MFIEEKTRAWFANEAKRTHLADLLTDPVLREAIGLVIEQAESDYLDEATSSTLAVERRHFRNRGIRSFPASLERLVGLPVANISEEPEPFAHITEDYLSRPRV